MSFHLTLATIVCNEMHKDYGIERLLSQAKTFADEIVVFDCESEDGTYEAACSVTDKVFRKKKTGSSDIGGYKQEIINMAKTPWILILDGDEALDPILLDIIISRRLMKDRPEIKGWWFPRRWVIDGIDTNILWPDYQQRLLSKGAVWLDGIHSTPSSEPSDKFNTGHIIHNVRYESIKKRWPEYIDLSGGMHRDFNNHTLKQIEKILETR